MKKFVNFVISVYLGIALLSIYAFFFHCIINQNQAGNQPQLFMKYMVYFVLKATWIMTLVMLIYRLVFNKGLSLYRLFFKVLYMLFVSIAIAIVIFRNGSFDEILYPRASFCVVCLLTGLTSLFVQEYFWYRERISNGD